MKAVLEFNLPEDREEFELHNSAGKLHMTLWDFSMYLRNKYKHAEPPSSQAAAEFEEVKEAFYNFLLEHEVEL